MVEMSGIWGMDRVNGTIFIEIYGEKLDFSSALEVEWEEKEEAIREKVLKIRSKR